MITACMDDREYGAQAILPLPELKVSFDRVWPWLKKAVARYGPTHRKWHVWQRIERGSAQLWTTEKCAVVTGIEVWPTGYRELQEWLAGGDLSDVLSLRPVVEALAHDKRCNRIMLTGRNGWGRAMPDFRRIATTYVKDIG